MYRVGVIGCRNIGVAHAQGLVGLDNAVLVAGCDLAPERLDEFQRRWQETWPGLARYTSHREMLERERLDIVTVATSDHRHADLVVDAAEAGVRGIFCEKPLATNLADADRMLAACARHGAILSVDHTRRFEPLWRRAKEIVDRGLIGPVQYVVGTLSGERAMLFRNGTHTVDAICWFAGAQPAWVMADLETGYEGYRAYGGDGGHVPASEPGAYGFIHFANGVRGLYVGGSKRTPLPKQRFEVVGETGRLLSDGGPSLCLLRGEAAETVVVPPAPVDGIAAGVQELVGLVDRGGDPASPGRAGHAVVEILVGFLESQHRGHAPVPIPVPRDDPPA